MSDNLIRITISKSDSDVTATQVFTEEQFAHAVTHDGLAVLLEALDHKANGIPNPVDTEKMFQSIAFTGMEAVTPQ